MSHDRIDAEKAVLGAMMIDPAAVDRGKVLLDPSYFTTDAHRKIAWHMYHLHEIGRSVDQLSVGDILHRGDLLDGVGGVEALAELASYVATGKNIDHNCKLVLQAHLKDELDKVEKDDANTDD